MDRERAKQYVAYTVDDTGCPGKPARQGYCEGDELKYRPVLIGWLCGFEPLFVAVHSYLDVRLDDDEAEDLARDYLEEIGWFSGTPTEADFIIR